MPRPAVSVGLSGDGPVDGYETKRRLAEVRENVRTACDCLTPCVLASSMKHVETDLRI